MRPVDSELLAGLPPAVLRRLRKRLQVVAARPGASLFAPGEPSELLYVVLSGHFELELDGDPLPVLPGEVVGLAGFVSGAPRRGRFLTMSGGTVGVLDRQALETLWVRFPELAAPFELRLARLLVDELRRENERLVALLRTPLVEAPEAVRLVMTGAPG